MKAKINKINPQLTDQQYNTRLPFSNKTRDLTHSVDIYSRHHVKSRNVKFVGKKKKKSNTVMSPLFGGAK
jgi:hypothetical protein